MTISIRALALAILALGAGCSEAPRTPEPAGDSRAHAAIDSLNARLSKAYRDRDPALYATVFTDTAVFEWPAFDTQRGRAAMSAMARANWAALRDMDLKLTVASRRIAGDQATEFGAFEQSYADSAGTRRTEYGRYVALLLKQRDGAWLMDRFFGFADSTSPRPAVR